jgi:hypothetical protein
MADAEIEVIRNLLAANPRPTELSQRRKRLDALGGQYPLPPMCASRRRMQAACRPSGPRPLRPTRHA